MKCAEMWCVVFSDITLCRNCSMRGMGSISEICIEGTLRCKDTCCEQEGLSQLYWEMSVMCVGRALRSMDRGPPEVCSSGALLCVQRYQVCSIISVGVNDFCLCRIAIWFVDKGPLKLIVRSI